MGVDRTEFSFEMEWIDHLSFNVRWDLPDAGDMLMDEPPAFGGSGKGPNATRAVVAGVANCLGASLLFCLQKSRADVEGFRVRASGTVTRNERGRLRLTGIRIEPVVKMPEGKMKRLDRCLDMFEDFCIVTESIRSGVPVDVQVYLVDDDGTENPV
jgi:uncharacterized OsmC-like protein